MIPALSSYAPDALLLPTEAAKILRAHPTTVLGLCAKGEIVAVRIGKRYRIRVSDLAQYLDGNTVGRVRPLTIPRRNGKRGVA